MRYLPHTDEEIASMLAAVRLSSLERCSESIPDGGLKFRSALEPALDEPTLMRHVEKLAAKNARPRC
jgi:hypothetical protein